MIDVEQEIYTRVEAVVKEYLESDNANHERMVNEPVKTPATFPFVAFYEADNYPYEKMQGENAEDFSLITYEADVFSDTVNSRVNTCRAIGAVIDAEMQSMGFVRIQMSPQIHEDNESILKLTVRYSAVVDKNKTIYRR